MNDRILEIILRARDEASATVEKATGRVSGSMEKMAGVAKVGAAALVAVGIAAAAMATQGIQHAGAMEGLQIALETVAGSAEAADRAMKTIRKTAQDSPFFETATLAEFVQVMAAAGQSIDDAVSSGLRFGDVMAAFGKGNAELSRLGNTLSQVMGKGKADVVDFKELVNSGWVSVRKDTAAAMGVTMAQFEDMVSAGLVGYDQITKAAEKYGGAAEKQSKTWNSLTQRMGETINNTLSTLVTKTGLFDSAKNSLDGMSSAIERITADGSPLYEILARLGTTLQQIVGVLVQVGTSIYTYLKPSLDELWSVVSTGLLPSLIELWNLLSPVLIPVLQLLGVIILDVIVLALRLMIDMLTATASVVAFFARTVSQEIAKVSAGFQIAMGWAQAFGNTAASVWNGVRDAAVNAWNYMRTMDWGAILVAVGRGIANSVIGLIEGAIKGATSGVPLLSDLGKNLRIPRFEQGGWTKEGLAYLHDGEYVMSRRELAGNPRSDSPMRGGGDIHITVNANVSEKIHIAQLGQELAWEMKLAGGY